jgi:hypothetical protein
MSVRIEPVGAPGVDGLLARLPELLRCHAERREVVFCGDVLDRELKELCGRYLAEDEDVVLRAGDPEFFDERERAALAWTHASVWDPAAADDALWERLHAQFSEAELVDLFYYLQWEIGNRAWLRTLGMAPDAATPPPS